MNAWWQMQQCYLENKSLIKMSIKDIAFFGHTIKFLLEKAIKLSRKEVKIWSYMP